MKRLKTDLSGIWKNVKCTLAVNVYASNISAPIFGGDVVFYTINMESINKSSIKAIEGESLIPVLPKHDFVIYIVSYSLLSPDGVYATAEVMITKLQDNDFDGRIKNSYPISYTTLLCSYSMLY